MPYRLRLVGVLALTVSAHDIEDFILARRASKRAELLDHQAPHPPPAPATAARPSLEAATRKPCPGIGVLRRRDMGSLGVSSFQMVAGVLLADAIGPGYRFHDEWYGPGRATDGVLQLGVQPTLEAANAMIADRASRQVTIRPTLQAELETAPWTMNATSAAAWVDDLRDVVCGGSGGGGGKGRGRRGSGGGGGGGGGGNATTTIVKMLAHWQHASYFHRYRDFIKAEVLRTSKDLRRAYFEPLIHPLDGGARPSAANAPLHFTLPEILCYMRLGDKRDAGDTALTFTSGFYDAVRPRTYMLETINSNFVAGLIEHTPTRAPTGAHRSAQAA